MSKPVLGRRAFVRTLMLGAAGAAASSLSPGRAEAATTLTILTVAPAGSALRTALDQAAKRVASETEGEVKVQIAVERTEDSALQKFRAGKAQGCVGSELLLGAVQSMLRVLALPRLLDSADKADLVSATLRPRFETLIRQKGFVLAGLCHAGDRSFTGTAAMPSLATLRALKLFVSPLDTPLGALVPRLSLDARAPSPDPLDALFAVGAVDVAAITSSQAMSSLSSGFHTTSFAMSAAWCGLLFAPSALEALSDTARAAVLRIFGQTFQGLAGKLRGECVIAKDKLKSLGGSSSAWSAADLATLDQAALKVREDLIDKVFTRDLLNEVLTAAGLPATVAP